MRSELCGYLWEEHSRQRNIGAYAMEGMAYSKNMADIFKEQQGMMG
jgi:hypothetical protein